VTNPILWEAGIQAMLGVPLLSGGDVIGVLHVGTLGTRRFTQEDAELLQIVADRVAGATQARQLEVERAAARALQRSLLPAAPPKVPGLEFATRYLPAGGADLGGDWYDVFVLPSGEAWVVTGDVGGHGFRASVVMGRLRSTIRAYALERLMPEAVLDLADRKLQHFEPNEIATVACAVLSPPFDVVRIASAGHLPPLIVAPGEEASFVETDRSPPLGTPLDFQRRATSVPLPPGSVLFLYTDGLVERRYEVIDVGLERLRKVLRPSAPDAVCRTVTEDLLGADDPEDDVAVVAVRSQPDHFIAD
jgi:serine phosphatase RsbU (regulator of sigma subunit)